MPAKTTPRSSLLAPAVLLTLALTGFAAPAAQAAEHAPRPNSKAGAWLLSLAPDWLRAWLPGGLGLDAGSCVDPDGRVVACAEPNGQALALDLGSCIDPDGHTVPGAGCPRS
jgi:hypothetical protein